MFIVENLWKIILGIAYICWTIYAFRDLYKWRDGKRKHGDWYNGENGTGFFIWGVVHIVIVFSVSLGFYIQHHGG